MKIVEVVAVVVVVVVTWDERMVGTASGGTRAA
jgi:hypothetical protein